MVEDRLGIAGPRRPEAQPQARGLLACPPAPPEAVPQALAERESRMPPTVCAFNRTRECFLCLCAVAAGLRDEARCCGIPQIAAQIVSRDGIWRKAPPGMYTVGALFPVDQVYLDPGYRVVQLIEHLHPLQLAAVHPDCASLLEVPAGTIFASRTQVGDQLLICCPEEIEAHWKRIQSQAAWAQRR